MFLLVFTLIGIMVCVSLFVLTHVLRRSVFVIAPNHIGYYILHGKAVERALYPGWNITGLGAQAYQVPIEATSKTITQQVTLPDGAEVEIAVAYTTEPDPECVWKLHANSKNLDNIFERKVKACLSNYSASTTGGPQDFETALKSYDDMRVEVTKALREKSYGVRFTEVDVVHIKTAGVMAKEDLRAAIRNKSKNYNEVEKAKRRAEKLRELEPLADHLRKVGTPEYEIKRIIERARIQILDDE